MAKEGPKESNSLQVVGSEQLFPKTGELNFDLPNTVPKAGYLCRTDKTLRAEPHWEGPSGGVCCDALYTPKIIIDNGFKIIGADGLVTPYGANTPFGDTKPSKIKRRLSIVPRS